MRFVNYFVVITFDLADDGKLCPSKPASFLHSQAAKQYARSQARAHAGVIAISRYVDRTTGGYVDYEILSQTGDVGLEVLDSGLINESHEMTEAAFQIAEG
jgi:hypothetical protein